jgi:broad specificity phosphatase PhoE
MKRAQQTLAPLLGHFNLPAETCQDLREVDFGDWTGLSWQQVRERYGIHPFEWLDKLHLAEIPNGECGRRFRDRVEPCIRGILARSEGQSVAVVCHGGVIRMILSILLDIPLAKTSVFEIEYASLTQLHLHPGRVEIQLLNFTPWRVQA